MPVCDKIFILRTIKFGESDLILHGLNPDGQRINLIAKSALKSRRRFGGGVLEPTHLVGITYKKGREAESLGVLNEAHLLEGFDKLRENYARLETALYFLKLISQVCKEGMADDRTLYNLLGHSLRALEETELVVVVRTLFELKLLRQQGVLPHDFEGRQWAKVSVRDHSEFQISMEEMTHLQDRVGALIHSYLD